MSQAQAARLRAALLDPLAAQQIEVAGSTAAAVLAPLFERDGELYAVLTKRRSDLRLHAGQISFPGGRREHGDADLIKPRCARPKRRSGSTPARSRSSERSLRRRPSSPTSRSIRSSA